MTIPAPPIPAGWYPDPRGVPQDRWWDGAAWTERTHALNAPVVSQAPPLPEYAQPVDAANPVPAYSAPSYDAPNPNPNSTAHVPAPELVPGRFYNFYNAKKDLAKGRNTFATNALLFGIVGFIINLVTFNFLGFLLGAAAVTWGIAGVVRAQNSGLGRKKAIWGLTLGVLTLVILMLGSSSGFQAGFAAASYDQAAVEQNIIDGTLEQSGAVITVVCPKSPSFIEDSEFQCIATGVDSTTALVTVTVQDDDGSIVWELGG